MQTNSEINIRLKLKSQLAKMINLKLRDKIQNIYLFIYILIGTYLLFLSTKTELNENQSWAAKISLSLPNT